MARQAWNDAEELNRLFSIVGMCHFSFKLFPMNFFPIKRIFALFFFFSLDSCTFILEPDTVMHYKCMCIYIYAYIYIYVYICIACLYLHIFLTFKKALLTPCEW